ncbi:MAG: hypothetical protein K2X01_03495 [Cyanobacteria bacterium]|nr:hypothetical protein [Cyanobacteriota bacterium]
MNRSLIAVLAVSVLLVGRVQAAAPSTEASKELKPAQNPAHHSELKPEAKHAHKANAHKHAYKAKQEKETENEAKEEKAEGKKS